MHGLERAVGAGSDRLLLVEPPAPGGGKRIDAAWLSIGCTPDKTLRRICELGL
jgi:hypothetical protein